MGLVLNINIITELPIWFSIFCVILGGLYAFFLYNKESKFTDASIWLVRLMAAFRFLVVTFLAFLLLAPFIKTLFNKIEKPVIIIAQDNSASILLNKDSTFYKTNYLEQLKALKNSLERKYEVKSYTFGENLEEGESVNYTQKTTHLSNAFEALQNKFYNKNVGALILASDGIFNQGANPVFNSNIEFPIYTIALGDTSAQRDIVLEELVYNKITFLGNQFPIEISGKALECLGSKTTLTIKRNGKELFKKQYKINNEDFLINENVLLDANEVGVQHYRVSLTVIDNEVSIVNNTKDVYIEVLDGRQNILILANAPHPDVKALKLSIERNENYKVTTELINDFDGITNPYNLVILHQLPQVFNLGLQKVLDSDISMLYILGNQTSIPQFNKLDVGLKIDKSGNRFNEILPIINNDFPLFNLSKKTAKSIGGLPPVIGPFGDYQVNKNAYVLINQKIGSVDTENPLLAFFQKNNKKAAVFASEGLWKWRMHDFMKNKNHDSFDELINKTIQFLSVKEDKSKFRIVTENIYFENEEIKFNAELYNESYELVNEPEIDIIIKGSEGGEFKFQFNRNAKAYILNAGILPVDFYTYKADVKFGSKDYIATGKFQIKPLLLEANNTIANLQLLQNIAQKFGGKMFYPSQMERIPEIINANNDITSIIYEENDLKEFINIKWIFYILLAFLSLEWALRKRNGAY